MKALKRFWSLLSDMCQVDLSKYETTDSDALSPNSDITAYFDPLFAQELQKRGYIADAKHITPKAVNRIKELNVSGESSEEAEVKLTSLRGIEFFVSLTGLYCHKNQLTTLDVSKNTILTGLFCSKNQLTSLDVSKNTALTELGCSINQLTSLDISKNTELIKMICESNPGDGTIFPVTAWFDNSTIPSGFTTMGWDYNGKNIKIDYRKLGSR